MTSVNLLTSIIIVFLELSFPGISECTTGDLHINPLCGTKMEHRIISEISGHNFFLETIIMSWEDLPRPMHLKTVSIILITEKSIYIYMIHIYNI